MLGPRLGRYDAGLDPLPLGCPVNAVMGMFVLWLVFLTDVNKKNTTNYTCNPRWGWLAFNSGSTYGVSEGKWKYAARAAVSTMMGSMGGGGVGLIFSLVNPKGIDILSQINGILGALVAITGRQKHREAENNRKKIKVFSSDPETQGAASCTKLGKL